MNKKELFELVSIILEVDPSMISESSTNNDFSSWDSMAHMSIISTIEERTGELYSEEEIVEMLSVDEILKILNLK
jgi:acyl carrier protein